MAKPHYSITILEKSNKLLSKVRISGGGRCNITHSCFDNRELVKNYPRGNKELLQVFSQFAVADTIAWFKQHGLFLKTEADGRMFPESNTSQSVIDCFMALTQKLQITIELQTEVLEIKKTTDFLLVTNKGNIKADAVICAMGGHNQSKFYNILKHLGHRIEEPLPSLFTFNLPEEPITKELQGISVQNADVRIKNSKLQYQGPVLITHWGLSGPAVLKLSAFAAKEFYPINYDTSIVVNWIYPVSLNQTEETVKQIQKEKHKSLPYTHAQFGLPKRLWEYLCEKSAISNQKPWAEISKQQLRTLATNLCQSEFRMKGKTTFKEEFVTCGGVDLKEIDFKTMQSKVVPGLFFCGEVLNIDGITGGFNFQSAWSTAWICSKNC